MQDLKYLLMSRRRNSSRNNCTILALMLASTSFQANIAHANPSGGQVVGGSATIVETGKKLDIHQHTQRTVIDWRSFDIEVDEHTQFYQPSSSATALNRVNSADPSRILGQLSANGNIILINPNGVFFGADSRVDVNGLIATTADIDSDTFMSGGNHLNIAGSPDASIVNEGMITAKEAGLVGLVAPHVENNGIIEAKMGRVHLASGDTVTADFYGDGLLKVEVTDENMTSQYVGNTGRIQADGGTILMTAAEARNTVNALVVAKGELKAPTVQKTGGKIIIGGANTKTHVDAKIDVSAGESGDKGGYVEITGKEITVAENATLNASGDGGGGEVLIGGDYQGQGDTDTAFKTTIEKGAEIYANATNAGDGGKVIVWADDSTDFHGVIEANGGTVSGDGGFVETSGKRILTSSGSVTAKAPNGKAGQWLLDPTDVTISHAGTEDVSGGTNATGVVDADTIEAALNAGTSVTITTDIGGADSGDITLDNVDITKSSANGDVSLVLLADSRIYTNGTNSIVFENDNNMVYLGAKSNVDVDDLTIQGTGSGTVDIILASRRSNNSVGAIHVQDSLFESNGGEILFSGGNSSFTQASVDDIDYLRLSGKASGQGSIDSGIILENSTLSSGAGDITLRGRAYSKKQNHGIHMHTNSVVTSTDGDITIFAEAKTNNTDEDNTGLFMASGSSISSTGTGANAGTITIRALGVYKGSNTPATGNHSIYMTGTGTQITSVDGDIDITANGATTSTGSWNHGLFLEDGATVTSTGTGVNAANINITATGGAGTEDNYAVYLTDTGTNISSINGDISVTGSGNGANSGNNNHGLYIVNDADILTTGDAALILDGTAGANVSSGLVTSGATVTIGGGSATGDFTFISDTMDFADLSVETTGSATIKAKTEPTTIGLAGGAGTLNLTATELGYFNPGTLIIGDSSDGAGLIDIDSWDMSGVSHDLEVYGGSIDVDGISNADSISMLFYGRTGDVDLDSLDLTNTGSGNETFHAVAAGSVLMNASTIDASGGTGTISVIGNSDRDTDLDGAIQLTSTDITTNGGNVVFSGGDSTQTIGSSNDLTYLKNTGYAFGNATYKIGVQLTTNSTVNTGSGHVDIRGQGANTVTDSNIGVKVDGIDVLETSSGNITLDGIGGDGGQRNSGVAIAGTNSTNNVIVTDTGSINITGTGGNGTSNENWGITFNNNGNIISNGMTGAGDITLNGTGGNGGSKNYGINLQSGKIISASGDIDLTGNGGDGSAGRNYGIYHWNTYKINSTGTGNDAANITLTGIGGDNASGSNYGVWFKKNAGADLTTIDGDIVVNGTGGNGGNKNFGVYLSQGFNISSTGTTSDAGTVTVNGTGGTGANTNYGVHISDASTLITSVNGNIAITGNGGDGSGNSNSGISIQGNATISSTGTTTDAATITLNGTGGTGVDTNDGILLDTDSLITSKIGAIDLTGTGGSAAGIDNNGISLSGGSDIVSTGTGTNAATITLNGTGGTGSNRNKGVQISNSGNSITSIDGNISITGTAVTTAGQNNIGVNIARGSINSIGTGANAATITLNGQGSGGTRENDGVRISLGGDINSVDGDISITGTGSSDSTQSGNHGIYLKKGEITSSNLASITLTGLKGARNSSGIKVDNAPNIVGQSGADNMLGDITLISDDLDLVDVSFKTDGDVVFNTYTTGGSISVGTTGSTLNISDADLGLFTAGGFVFGKTNGGDLTFDSGHNFGTSQITGLSGGTVTLDSTLSTNYSGAGSGIVLATRESFVNNVGSSALSTPNSRWLVYSVAPNMNTRNGLSSNFVKYSKTYSYPPGSVTATGNGFLYSIAAPPIQYDLPSTWQKVAYTGSDSGTSTSVFNTSELSSTGLPTDPLLQTMTEDVFSLPPEMLSVVIVDKDGGGNDKSADYNLLNDGYAESRIDLTGVSVIIDGKLAKKFGLTQEKINEMFQ